MKILHSTPPSIALDDDALGVDKIAQCSSYYEDNGDARHQSYNVIPVFLNLNFNFSIMNPDPDTELKAIMNITLIHSCKDSSE